jgi:hypothetical protein
MATKTWAASGSSSWNTAGNWSPSGVPGSSDDVVFDGTSTQACTCDVAIDIASLSVGSGYSGKLDFADSSYSHAISGDITLAGTGEVDLGNSTSSIGGDFNIASQSTFTRGTSTVVLTGSSKTTNVIDYNHRLNNLTIDGSILTGAGSTDYLYVAGSFVINTTKSLDVRGGNFYADGTVFTNNGTLTLTGAGNIVFNGSTTTTITVGTITASGSQYIYSTKNANLNAGSLGVRFWHNLGGNSRAITFNGNFTFQNDLDINTTTGTCTVNNGGNHDLTFQGDINVTGNLSWTKGTGTITFSGSGGQNIDFNGESVEDIVVNKSAVYAVLVGDVQTDSLTVTSGTLYVDASVNVDVVGNVTMAAGTRIGDFDVPSAVFSIGGNLDINGTSGSECTWSDSDIDTLTGTGSASYCEVYNSTNSSGTAIDATDNCTDSGGNTGWTFSAGTTGVFIGSTEITAMYIGSTEITAVYQGSTPIWPA